MFASLLLTMLVMHQAVAGPAHTLALTMASQAAKIPRTIRAPFRNTEMMTARGFGKRSESVRLIDCKFIIKSSSPPSPSFLSGKKTINFQLTVPSSIEFSEDGVHFEEAAEGGHRFPLNFIVDELLANPPLLRQLVRRFIDVNNDGIITQQELMIGRDQ